jgi:hypothetical protein
MDWTFQSLLDLVTTWVQDADQAPRKSIVGTLCCSEFLTLVGDALDPSFMQRFRLMLYSLSLWWTSGDPKPEQYLTLGHGLGHAVLNDLEQMLTPHFLSSQLSLSKYQSLFLVLLGCLFAVGYCRKPCNNTDQLDSIPCDPHVNPETDRENWLHNARQEHLTSMLAHYILLIGNRLGHRFDEKTEEGFVAATLDRIQKRGKFWWINERVEMQRYPSRQQTELDIATENTLAQVQADDTAGCHPRDVWPAEVNAPLVPHQHTGSIFDVENPAAQSPWNSISKVTEAAPRTYELSRLTPPGMHLMQCHNPPQMMYYNPPTMGYHSQSDMPWHDS